VAGRIRRKPTNISPLKRVNFEPADEGEQSRGIDGTKMAADNRYTG